MPRIVLAHGVLALAVGLSAFVPAEARVVRVRTADVTAAAALPEPEPYVALDDQPYRIAPGDQLTVDFGVHISGAPLRYDVPVRPDGQISLHPIGDQLAAGLTPMELDSVLTSRYVSVFKEPNLTVTVTRVAGNLVHVFGQVAQPGSYEMTPNATVLQAVTQAGGFAADASIGNVVLMRRTGESSLIARKLSLDQVYKEGAAGQNPFVRRFDIVYVPRSTIGKVNKFVDQYFTKVIVFPQAYIQGWYAFQRR